MMADTLESKESQTSNNFSTPEKKYGSGKGYASLLIITSTIAFIASWALVLERLELYKDSSHKSACDLGGVLSCSTVMQSPQATTFGFPNPLLGIVGFAVTLTIGVVLLTGAKLPRWFMICLFIGVSLATLFIIYLWYTAVFVLAMLCPYCMVVWVMIVPMFWQTLKLMISKGIFSLGKTLDICLTEWNWVFIVITYIVLTASLVFGFMFLFT